MVMEAISATKHAKLILQFKLLCNVVLYTIMITIME